LQEIQDRKLEYSAQTKKLNGTILHLEEKLAKYLKIEEEFTALELPLGYTHGSFLELISKFNETRVRMQPSHRFAYVIQPFLKMFVGSCDCRMPEELQEELTRVRAELLDKDAAWSAERELLIQQQAPPIHSQPILQPASVGSSAEEKLREQLRRQDKMVRALRDVIKQLGVSPSSFPSRPFYNHKLLDAVQFLNQFSTKSIPWHEPSVSILRMQKRSS
jgi:hypothetical protein